MKEVKAKISELIPSCHFMHNEELYAIDNGNNIIKLEDYNNFHCCCGRCPRPYRELDRNLEVSVLAVPSIDGTLTDKSWDFLLNKKN